MSYLAMCHPTWPCAESLAVFDHQPVIRLRWLEHTFGEQCPCVDKALHDPREKELAPVIWNWTCVRRGDCGRYEIGAGLTPSEADRLIRQRDFELLNKFDVVANRLRRRLESAKNVRVVYVVPCLECDLSDEARAILFERTRRFLPDAHIVDSVYRSSCLEGVICERHGDRPRVRPPFISDLDGKEGQKTDILRYLEHTARAFIQFLWDLKYNCIDPHDTERKDPRDRTCNANRHYFAVLGRYLRSSQWTLPPERALNRRDLRHCSKRLKAPDGPGDFVWKQSDSHPGIVALLPRNERPRRLRLIRDGKVIATLNYAGKFDGDGRPLYRTTVSQVQVYSVTNAVLRSELGCRVLKHPGIRID